MPTIREFIASHVYITGQCVLVPTKVFASGFDAEVYDMQSGDRWNTQTYICLSDAISEGYRVLSEVDSANLRPESQLARKLKELQVKKLTQTISEYSLTPVIEEVGK